MLSSLFDPSDVKWWTDLSSRGQFLLCMWWFLQVNLDRQLCNREQSVQQDGALGCWVQDASVNHPDQTDPSPVPEVCTWRVDAKTFQHIFALCLLAFASLNPHLRGHFTLHSAKNWGKCATMGSSNQISRQSWQQQLRWSAITVHKWTADAVDVEVMQEPFHFHKQANHGEETLVLHQCSDGACHICLAWNSVNGRNRHVEDDILCAQQCISDLASFWICSHRWQEDDNLGLNGSKINCWASAKDILMHFNAAQQTCNKWIWFLMHLTTNLNLATLW